MRYFSKYNPKSFFVVGLIIFALSFFLSSSIFAEGPGCTDPLAINYNATSTIENGTCTYPTLTVSTLGSQLPSFETPMNLDLGGAFTFQTDEGSVVVNEITIKQVGSFPIESIGDVELIYAESSGGVCEDVAPSGSSLGGGNFEEGNIVTINNGEPMTVSTIKVCLYVVYNTLPDSTEDLLGYSIDFEISTAEDIVLSAASANIEMNAPLNISGVSILTDGSITTSLLSLKMADETKDPTVFYLKDDSIWKKAGTGTSTRLTNSNLIVQALDFERLTRSIGEGIVRMSLTMSNVATGTPASYLNFAKTYTTTASTRSNISGSSVTSVHTEILPVIILSGTASTTITVGDSYTDAGATAVDALGVNITSLIVTGGLPISTVATGTHQVTYNVTDAYGNSATPKTRTVTVIASETVPDAPTIGTATAGNATSTITYTAPGNDGGSAILYYTVTSSSTGAVISATTTSSTTATLTGLTNGTAYTFSVKATNAIGTSASSSASNPVTPATVPGAPTIGTATAGNATSTVTYTAPVSNGGSPILYYTVTSNPGSISASTTSSTTATVTGLTNDTAYTFTVTATNAAGISTSSSASNSVTPTAPATFMVATCPGTETNDGDYKVCKFTSSGTFTVTTLGDGLVDVLVVGGGGGGGGYNYAGGSGGGGGGGYTSTTSLSISLAAHSVTVGAGGSAGSNGAHGNSGGASSFGSYISVLGGGGGGRSPLVAEQAPSGGSGGGGGGKSGSKTSTGGAGTSGQGYAGGTGKGSVNSGDGGGGGGAGGAGHYQAGYANVDGGAGKANSITGTSLYYAGGGGGGGVYIAGGLGGSSVGGRGSGRMEDLNSSTPTANRGGGGGGGAQDDSPAVWRPPSSGADGVVIIRYKYK
ncbi:MAG: glycine-rich domain-containing protein [Candidatus Paceibacterota bacterium]